MTEDERAIHALVDDWMSATRAGDGKAVLEMMTDDVVFMVPGHDPFGKEAFEAAIEQQADMAIEGSSEIKELNVLGDWGYMRSFVDVTMTPKGGEPVSRHGYTLTILKKGDDGRWRIACDANLVA